MNLNTIKNISKPKWTRITKQAITDHFNREFFRQASESYKMTNILQTKSKPILEQYMTTLSRRQACAIFRIRCKMTKAADNMTGSTTFPICTRCDQNLESDHHLFTDCSGTQSLRLKYAIQGTDPVFNNNTSIDILKNYALFTIEIGLTTYVTQTEHHHQQDQ